MFILTCCHQLNLFSLIFTAVFNSTCCRRPNPRPSLWIYACIYFLTKPFQNQSYAKHSSAHFRRHYSRERAPTLHYQRQFFLSSPFFTTAMARKACRTNVCILNSHLHNSKLAAACMKIAALRSAIAHASILLRLVALVDRSKVPIFESSHV